MRIRAIRGSDEASSNYVSRTTSEPKKQSKRIQAIWASRANIEAIQLLSQQASQSANQPTNQQTNQPINRQATNQSTNQATDQPISRPTNHGADLANYFQNKRLRPPLPRKVLVMMMRMMWRVQKSALKLLKIAYLKVKPLYFIKKCTRSSQSKFLWD